MERQRDRDRMIHIPPCLHVVISILYIYHTLRPRLQTIICFGYVYDVPYCNHGLQAASADYDATILCTLKHIIYVL